MTKEELDASVSVAIARLHQAMARVANGDVSAIKALYSHTSEATSFYGWGGYEKGWEAVSGRWDWAGAQFKGGSVRHENISTVVTPSASKASRRGRAEATNASGVASRVARTVEAMPPPALAISS